MASLSHLSSSAGTSPESFGASLGLFVSLFRRLSVGHPKVSEGKDGEAEQMPEAGKEALLLPCKGPEMNSLLLQVKGALTLPQLISHFREGAQWSVNIFRKKKDWYRQ